ncbi:MAG: hypothetical protein ACI8RZ_001672 [Myxococcota bacterium]|jgi:hypothetical protein
MTPPKWTRTHRKKLHGSRVPHRLDPLDVAPDGAEAWQALVTGGRLLKANPRIDVIGEDDNSTAQITAVWNQIAARERPERLDPATEPHRVIIACLEGLTGSGDSKRFRKWEAWAPYRQLVGFWASYGVDVAIQAICAPIPFSSTGSSSYGTDGSQGSIHLASLPPDAPAVGHGSSFLRHEPLWWALRCHLSHASEDDFAAALAAAGPLYAQLEAATDSNSEANLSSLAFAFSRDGAWLRARAQRYANGDAISHPLQLIAGLTDPELAMACIERTMNWRMLSYNAIFYAFDMIESMGPAGAEALLQRICIERDVKSDYRKGLQSAIKLARTAQA